MSIRFNVDEILEMAETIEVNGAKFYRKAAEQISDATARGLMLDLAATEDVHRETFAAMRRGLSAKEKGESFVPPDEEVVRYLRAWADGQVFDVTKDPSEELTGEESFEDILRIALGREKDSVVFYLGFKDATPKTWGREKIDEIIREEMRHIAVLTTELARVRGELQ